MIRWLQSKRGQPNQQCNRGEVLVLHRRSEISKSTITRAAEERKQHSSKQAVISHNCRYLHEQLFPSLRAPYRLDNCVASQGAMNTVRTSFRFVGSQTTRIKDGVMFVPFYSSTILKGCGIYCSSFLQRSFYCRLDCNRAETPWTMVFSKWDFGVYVFGACASTDTYCTMLTNYVDYGGKDPKALATLLATVRYGNFVLYRYRIDTLRSTDE